MNELNIAKHAAEKAADLITNALLSVSRECRNALWEDVYYGHGALNEGKWARFVAGGGLTAPGTPSVLSALRDEALAARDTYRALREADKARRAAGIKLVRPQAPVPDVSVSVTEVRRSGIRGDAIKATVNGETPFVRKTGGSKYNYVGVQVSADGRLYLSANRTAKVAPYSSYWRVVSVLPIPSRVSRPESAPAA